MAASCYRPYFLVCQEKDCSSVEEVLRALASQDEVIFCAVYDERLKRSKTNNFAREKQSS